MATAKQRIPSASTACVAKQRICVKPSTSISWESKTFSENKYVYPKEKIIIKNIVRRRKEKFIVCKGKRKKGTSNLLSIA